MSVVKLACGCAVLAIVAASQLSHWTGFVGAGGASAALMGGTLPLAPAAPVSPAAFSPAIAGPSGIETIAPDPLGQYFTAVEIMGERLPVLVDTGASYVLLSFEDAGRLGVQPFPADFKYEFSTANGRAFAARILLPAIRLGRIEVRDVQAYVSGRGALAHSLLGMSFLSKLSGFRVEDGHLILRQ